jgi:glycosyltransferase involved in cell wall biosynthesis
MKVLLIHNKYQQFGGEDAAAIAEGLLLEERGNEVIRYTRHNDEIKNYSLLNKIEFVPETIYSFGTRRDLRDLVTASRPDVAYIHNVYPLVSPSVYHTLREIGVPVTQVLHDSRPLCANSVCFTQGSVCERCKNGNYLNAVRYRCFRESYALSALYAASLGLNRMAGMLRKVNYICLTEFTRLKMLEVGVPSEHLFIRPNFIDVNQVGPCYDSGNYAVFLGRLHQTKGVWTMIRAFEIMRDVRLKIVGTGPEEFALKNYAQEKNMTNVEFVGFKSGTEKMDLLRGSRFVVVPSEFYEICPVTILEAYAAGKAVIASDIGGVPYVVREGKSGLLVQPGSVPDLVEKIGRLVDRPAEAEEMGRWARQLVEAEYGADRAYSTLMDIFARVMKA